MRVLVLGADGMLGHQTVRALHAAGHEPIAAVRKPPNAVVAKALANAPVSIGVEARLPDSVVGVLGHSRPDAVINCIGIVKQRPEAKDAIESIRVNSLFPHELAALCAVRGARLIHVSTDCVFSGDKGSYTEQDHADPRDLYGRTKLVGELHAEETVTLRTSIIGLELGRAESLVEWFLRQPNQAPGWTRAMYSGVTTMELARIMINILEHGSTISGLWHVSGDPISKFELLSSLHDALRSDVTIVPDDTVSIDRTLDSSRFRESTVWKPPDWNTMLAELAEYVREREASRDA